MMSAPLNITMFLILAAILSSTDAFWYCRWLSLPQPSSKPPGDRCELDRPPCDICRCPIDVTIAVRDVLTSPGLDQNITVANYPQQTLIHFLERAVDLDASFKFSATYFKDLGYFIDTINGVSGNSSAKTYWQISSLPSGNALNCGVSSYLPDNHETLLFNFTTWG